ncbi:MAG TPA: hypothetical protein VEU31_00240 [Candidatus Acidoferrales bacterium]|nr:hypothetical protein [Candidatus Acidoferrales bacterium]
MKNDCGRWKDELLEAALTGTVAPELEQHLASCAGCAKALEALRERRGRLDALLPRVARSAEPPAGLGATVLAAAKAAEHQGTARRRWTWRLAAATAAVAATVTIALLARRAPRRNLDSEIAAAERLARWQAPSDVLLETPSYEVLRSMPKLGETYLQMPLRTKEEERK